MCSHRLGKKENELQLEKAEKRGSERVRARAIGEVEEGGKYERGTNVSCSR